MMKSIRCRILEWYYWRKFGVCPIHLELARSGGGYSPKWICDTCDAENQVKNENRILDIQSSKANLRFEALATVKRLELGTKNNKR